MYVRFAALACLIIVACGGGSDVSEPECTDAACRQSAVLARFAEDPAAGAQAVAALPSEIERSAAVARILEMHPSQVSELCGGLPEGKLRVRCQRTADRPHLWQKRTKPVTTGARQAGGPKSHRLTPEQPKASALADVVPDLGVCAKGPDPHTCAWARAMELGAEGKVRAAASRCSAIEVTEGSAELWQAECRFSAAEASIRSLGAAAYAGAAQLCLTAGQFQERCLIHLSRDLAVRTPAADQAPGPALQASVEAADAIAEFWSGDSAAEKFVDHYWSLAMGYSYLRAETVSGDIIDGVPKRVLPHIHAAAAWRLMQNPSESSRSLSEWAALLDAALARRMRRPPGDLKTVHMPGVGNLWHAGTYEQEPIRAVIYLGMGRRALADDPQVDRQISLLEAAARHPTGMAGLIKEGAQADAGPIRWTAERLLSVGGLPRAIKKGPKK